MPYSEGRPRAAQRRLALLSAILLLVLKAPRGGFLADRLVGVVLVAVVVGGVFSDAGATVARLSLVCLAILVFGVGLTLAPASLRILWQQPRLVALATLLPWMVLIPLAFLAVQLACGPVSGGLLALASAPADVSAVLLTAVGGGEAGLATTVVACSLLLTPLVVAGTFALAGLPGATDPSGLLLELGLGVGLPLLLALIVRSTSGLRLQPLLVHYGGDVGTVGLALLMVGAGASARLTLQSSEFSRTEYALAVAGIFAVLVLPFALGAGAGTILRLPAPRTTALIFACGMREFGVAAAVAQLADPPGAAVPALYGIVLMLLSATVAARLARRSAFWTIVGGRSAS